FAAVQGPPATGFFPQAAPSPTGSFIAPGGWGAAAAPGASGKFVAPAPAPSGGFRAVAAATPPSGGFSAVDPYDPLAAASPAPGFGTNPSGPPPSTASEAGEISSGELGVGKRFGK